MVAGAPFGLTVMASVFVSVPAEFLAWICTLVVSTVPGSTFWAGQRRAASPYI